jgi:hypothetical protein
VKEWIETRPYGPFPTIRALLKANEAALERLSQEQQLSTTAARDDSDDEEGPEDSKEPEDCAVNSTIEIQTSTNEVVKREKYRLHLMKLATTAVISYMCAYVEEALQDKYRDPATEETINIRFVSVPEYNQSCIDHLYSSRPVLFGKASGVPQLQRDARSDRTCPTPRSTMSRAGRGCPLPQKLREDRIE